MTQTAPFTAKYMTIEDYLAYDDGTETRYELEDGVLVEMTLESTINSAIARFLLFELAKFVPNKLLAYKDTAIEVTGRRARARHPDLLLHSEDSYTAILSSKQAILLRDMPPPAIVVEVVSPGKINRDRDYRYKWTEYAARGIAEYWIVDPEAQQITVCLWVDGQYEDKIYVGDNSIQSTVIPLFNLTAAQILTFGEDQLPLQT